MIAEIAMTTTSCHWNFNAIWPASENITYLRSNAITNLLVKYILKYFTNNMHKTMRIENLTYLPRWRCRLERSSRMRTFGCSNDSRHRPKAWKQVVTVPLLNARQQVLVSLVLWDDHYKRKFCVTGGVAR